MTGETTAAQVARHTRPDMCCALNQVTYSGVGAPMDNDTWTNFGLTFNGSCDSSFLSSYGSSGLLGSGNPLSSSSSSPAVSTSG